VKLLLYSHTFAPNIGGIETITALLARGLARLPATSNAPKPQVIVVTDTPASGLDDVKFPFPLIRQPGFLALAKLIRTADVVQIAGPAFFPMLLSRWFGKPYVIEHHGYQAICPNGILLERPASTICPGYFQAGRYRKCIKCESQEMSWLRSALKVAGNILRHYLAKRASTNVAVSQHAAKRIALPHTQVIYHGLQCGSLQSSQPAATASTAPAKIRFGCVGRFVPEKGISVLIDAARRLRAQRRDFEIILVGDGPQRPQIEKLIQLADAGEYVRITGFLSGENLTAEVNALDVVVMPSIWEETAGLAAMEQMARGRLVIASDIGGLGEIVGDAGLKFPAGDAGRLADQMEKVLQRSPEISGLGEAAQNRALSLFPVDRMVSEHLAAYRKLGS
jgi:glycogen synthase